MRHLLLPIALCAATASTAAQNCLDGNFGFRIANQAPDWLSTLVPIGFAFPLGGQTYTGMYVTDHGFVALTNNGVPPPPATPSLYAPTLTNFALGAPKICALYADIVGEDGDIFVDNQPSRCLVTWRNMRNFGFPALFDLQIALYPNGDVRMVFGPGVTNDSVFGSPASNGICGISLGGSLPLPPATDLSLGGATTSASLYEIWTTVRTFDLANNSMWFSANAGGYSFGIFGAGANCASAPHFGTSCGGLRHRAMGLPVLGNANYLLRIDNLPSVLPYGIINLGNAVNPGTPLASLGAPGCEGYTDLAFGSVTGSITAFGLSDVSLAIPATASLVGAQFASQAIAFSTATPLGAVTSNGLLSTVGLGY